MRIGILGCGYVGQSMALQWKKEGHHLAVTTRQPQRVPFLRTLANDVYLLPAQSLDSFIKQQDALLISVAPNPSDNYTATYLETAEQVAACADSASALRQILYTSSTSVYGDHAGAWVDENTPIACTHENGKILYETEQTLLKCLSKNRQVCILRLGEIYGPGREIEQRLKRMHHQVFAGNGRSYTNLIHIKDIVAALDFALKNHLQGIYNLCSDFHLPRADFYERLCQQEKLPSIQWDPTRLTSHGGNRRVSNKKIKDEGFVFTHPDFFNTKEKC